MHTVIRVAKTLRQLMRKWGFNQGQLAARAGCSQPVISNILSGKSKRLSLELAAKVSDALEVSLDQMLGREGAVRERPASSELEHKLQTIEDGLRRLISRETKPESDHRRIDARELAMHRAIAEKILRNPELLSIARSNIARWRQKSQNAAYLDEWETILSAPVDEVVKAMCDDSDEGARLRQSSPFAGILTEEERLAIHDAFRARTYYSSSR